MSILSKLSRDYTCYELGHTWNTSCTGAWMDIALATYKYSFKTYFTLYLIAAILQKKNKEYYIYNFLPEILRSTTFLGTNGFMFLVGFCSWRTVRKFNRLSVGFMPSMFAAFIAILIERDNRRRLLSVYMANIAAETLYLMAKARGIVRPIPLGELWLFSGVSALYMYLFRLDKLGSAMTSAFQFLVGTSEQITEVDKPKTKVSVLYQQMSETLERFLCRLWGPWTRHDLCTHSKSCFQYTLEGGVFPLAVGVGLQSLLTLVGRLGQLVRAPRRVLASLFSRSNFALGAFLGSFAAIFRCLQCSLRRSRGTNDNWHTLVSGWVAAWSMLFFRSSSLALYMASKLVETLYIKGMQAGKLPSLPYGDIILYAVATSVVFHAGVLEPHNIRPAYYNFLLNITEGKIALMNRHLMDEWGTGASRLSPNFWPKYDPRVTDLAFETAESFHRKN